APPTAGSHCAPRPARILLLTTPSSLTVTVAQPPARVLPGRLRPFLPTASTPRIQSRTKARRPAALTRSHQEPALRRPPEGPPAAPAPPQGQPPAVSTPV